MQDVFIEKLDALKGTEVKLHVDPQVQPQFLNIIQFFLPSKLKFKQLERLESLDIIVLA